MRRCQLVVGGALCALSLLAAPAHALQDGLARTPPMGWDGWYSQGCGMDETVMRQTVVDLARTGLRGAGYRYVIVDDCWMARTRDKAGDLQPDPVRFPSGIPALAKFIHARGMKLGIYLAGGRTTCQGRAGSFGRLPRDIAKVASWGADFIKIDWCAPRTLAPVQATFARAEAAIVKTGRPIVLSICEGGGGHPWVWGPRVANMWRTTKDMPWYGRADRWGAMLKVASLTERVAGTSGPGGWNDPDLLQVGVAQLSPDESRASMSIWTMLAAPLIAANDVRHMSAYTLATLTNREALAIDQDRLGRAGRIVSTQAGVELWARELANGDRAVMVLNTRSRPTKWSVNADQIFGRDGAGWDVRDVWSHTTSTTPGQFETTVPGHGATLFRIGPGSSAASVVQSLMRFPGWSHWSHQPVLR
jgi:alpha-galactosidase